VISLNNNVFHPQTRVPCSGIDIPEIYTHTTRKTLRKQEKSMNKPPEIPSQEHQVRIEIQDAIADGVYANLSFITTNNSEFILDFARFLPGNSRGRVVSRVVLSPVHIKAFVKSLSDAVENFEKTFGTITQDSAQKNIGFKLNPGGNEKEEKKE
jgi:hypothetical protein